MLAGFEVLLRNELFLEQLFVALKIVLRELGPVFSAEDADPGQFDLFRSRPCLQHSELSSHLVDVGFAFQQCRAIVPVREASDRVARPDPIAFVHANFFDGAANLGPHVRILDGQNQEWSRDPEIHSAEEQEWQNNSWQ